MEKLKLDDSSYDSIYEKAMQRLKQQAPWWSHREVSDPGITLIEMWSFLCDMQSFYLDQVQESHYRKYLKLLGIAPDEGQFAWAWVLFDEIDMDTVLPEGTKLQAADMVFETEEEVKLTANHMISFYLESEDPQEAGKDYLSLMNRSRKASFPLKAGKQLFSFELKHSVEKGETIDLFVLLDETNQRNPAEAGYFMAELIWEYWAQGKYREARVIRDDTCGLLYSGRVLLQIDSALEAREEKGGYPIRCRIKKGTFDVFPVLYRISLNVVKVFQKNTLCREENIYISPETSSVLLKSYLAQTGRIEVYRGCGEDQWEECTERCDIMPPVSSFRQQRYLHLKEDFLQEMSAREDKTLKIVCSVPEVWDMYVPCAIMGVSTQQITLPWENIRRDCVKLMLRQGDGEPMFWQYHSKEPEEERFPHAWHWQEEINVIEFGDGRHGDIPAAARDGLRLNELVLWEGEKGNVSIKKITKLEKPELLPGITCYNPMSGRQGRGRKKPSEQFAAINEIITQKNRMVTAEDVKEIAKKTQGLIITDAQAVWKNGRISVTISPAVSLKKEYCIQKYIQGVKNHLEQYRLVASQIEVEIEDRN